MPESPDENPLEPRREPVQARSRATVEAMLEATAQLLTEEGYHDTSTNKIAERAGVSVGSLYQYFPGKDALVFSLLQRHVDGQLAILTESLAGLEVDSPRELVRATVRALVETHRQAPDLTRVLFEQIPRTGKFDLIEAWTQKCSQLVVMAMAARDDMSRPSDPELAAWIVVNAFNGVLQGALLAGRDVLEDEKLLEELSELFCRYLIEDG